MMDNLKKTDPAVFDSIISETRRQADGLELIASENFVSEAVLEAMGILTIRVERDDELEAGIAAAISASFSAGQGVALILTQKILGAKAF